MSIKEKKEEDTFEINIKKWAQESTIHSVPHIFRSRNKIHKIFWVCCLFGFFIYCFYQIVTNMIIFSKHNTLQSMNVINKCSIDFPAVDICNLNSINYEYTLWLLTDELQKEFEDKLNNCPTNSTTSGCLKVNNEIAKSFNFAADLLFNIGVHSGFDLKQMLISCTFNGKSCDREDFYYYYNYDFGSCYRFNGGRVKYWKSFKKVDSIFDGKPMMNVSWIEEDKMIKQVYQAGSENGLELELFIDNPAISNDPDYKQFNYKSGIHLIVHDRNDIVYPDEEGIDISTGQQTNVAISKYNYNRLSTPSRKCISHLNKKTAKGNLIREKILNEFGERVYDQKFCLKFCKQKYFEDKCSCYYSKLPAPTKLLKNYFNENMEKYRPDPMNFFKDDNLTTPCFSSKQMNCIMEYEQIFYQHEEATKCIENCDIECHSKIFVEKISVAQYPTKWYFFILLVFIIF
jgi:hypothetical protein